MTATTSKRQTSFVDTTELGKINKESFQLELQKYNALKAVSQEQIRKRFGDVHQVFHDTFMQILKGNKKFSAAQFHDFRSAIQYYQDLEKLS